MWGRANTSTQVVRRLFSRVGIRSTRQVDAFVNAERERRLNILHLSRDGDLFYFLTHSLTSHPLYVTFSCPFRGEGRGGEGDNLENFPPPPSPLSSFTLMSHQLIAFLRIQLRFHRFQTQSWRLRAWDMLIERSLTQISALREVLCSVSTGYRNLSFELSLRFKTVSTSVMV